MFDTRGSVEFYGTGGHTFVGPPDERWDRVMLIRQSSLEAFFAFASDAEYLAGVGHRTAALEDRSSNGSCLDLGDPECRAAQA